MVARSLKPNVIRSDTRPMPPPPLKNGTSRPPAAGKSTANFVRKAVTFPSVCEIKRREDRRPREKRLSEEAVLREIDVPHVKHFEVERSVAVRHHPKS